MGLNNPSEGFQNAQAYQVPGLPFVITTASAGKIEFPHVTRSLHITADGGDVVIAFATASTATRQFTIKSGTTIELPVRVREIWLISGTMSCLASLTTIPRYSMPELNPSNWSGIQ